MGISNSDRAEWRQLLFVFWKECCETVLSLLVNSRFISFETFFVLYTIRSCDKEEEVFDMVISAVSGLCKGNLDLPIIGQAFVLPYSTRELLHAPCELFTGVSASYRLFCCSPTSVCYTDLFTVGYWNVFSIIIGWEIEFTIFVCFIFTAIK